MAAPGHGVLGLVDLVLQPVVVPRLLVVIVRLERGHEVLDPHVGGLAESVGLAALAVNSLKSLALVHRVLIADRARARGASRARLEFRRHHALLKDDEEKLPQRCPCSNGEANPRVRSL